VDDRYEGIDLPGRRLAAPGFVVSATWTAPEMLRFVRTWSGVQSCMKTTGKDPVAQLAPRVEGAWGSPDSVREVRWPVYLRASRL
jgi:hypothetical protein